MDINTLRGLATLFALIAFLAMVIWAYSGKRRKDFDEAASLPFADDLPTVPMPQNKAQGKNQEHKINDAVPMANSRDRGVKK